MKIYDADGLEKPGVPGATGAQGPVGPPVFLIGDVGEDGLPGPPGMAGLGGAAGADGATGAQGPAGPAIFLLDESFDGEPGFPGQPGAAGAPGSPGETGTAGPAGPAVFLVGEGEPGEVGSPGPAGAAGPAGSPGTTGAQGPTGPAVFLLNDGSDGEQGFPGPTGAAGAAGAPGAGITVDAMTGDVSNSTTTLAKLTALDQVVDVGTWMFKYIIIHQAAATTTGIKFAVNHTGTLTAFVLWKMHAAVSSTGSDTTQRNVTASTSFVLPNIQVEILKNVTMGPTTAIVTQDSNAMTIMEGVMVVSVSGNIELYSASEVAAATTVKAGTSLILIKTA